MVGDPSLCEAVTRLKAVTSTCTGEARTARAKQNSPIIPASLGDSNAASHSHEVFPMQIVKTREGQ